MSDKTKERPVREGDVRIVTLEVKCQVEKKWIATDFDNEGNPIDTKQVLVYTPLYNQPHIVKDQPSIFLAQGTN
jgi:hypothetical protein